MLRQNFDQGWLLSKGGGSMMEQMTSGGGPQAEPVQIPHDAMIHETPDAGDVSGAQTGFYPGGEYTYIKHFEAPVCWEEQDVQLYFGGVYQTAKVYLNGSHVKTNLYGYSGFYVPLNDYLHYGEDNELKVIANNPTPNSRWYCGSGIYRSVELIVGGDVHILADGVKATTLLANEDEAILNVETKFVNQTRKRQLIFVKLTLSDGEDVVKTDSVQITLYGGETETVRQNLSIASPKLWNVDTPNLYDLKVEIVRDGEVIDTDTERIGLRVLTVDAEHGLRINGKETLLKGTCIHHDNGIIGAATFADAEKRRAKQMREAGFNSIRSAHHPMSKEMLDACDEYGLVVMDELADMWFEKKNINDFSNYFELCWQEEAARMVAKDYNHPCVIMYSSGNEIIDLSHEIGGRMNRKICNYLHELDATRFTTTAVNGLLASGDKMALIAMDVMKKAGIDPEQMMAAAASGASEAGDDVSIMNQMMSLMDSDDVAIHPLMTACFEEAAQASDIAGFNYLTGRHEMEKDLHPNKPIVGTETYPADIVRLWRIVEDNHHVLGDYTWTGYDYLGEAGCGIFYYDGTVNFSSHYPDRMAYIGDIDLIGNRRPISFLREVVYGDRKAPYLAVIRTDKYGKKHSKTSWMYKDNISSWTWPGYEGQKTEVEIYSVDPEVELFLNGQSLGKKSAGRDHSFTAVYEEVTYEPGELTAVSYKDGFETGRFTLTTASDDLVMHIDTDGCTCLKADPESLKFVTVTLTDQNGNENLFAQKTVSVKVEGEGILQGYGSANPQATRSYDDTTCETYDGKVMACVRSNGNPGTVTVTFSAEGLEDAVVTLTAK